MPEENITTKFKLDISEFKKGITEANQQIKEANSVFNKATSGMDNWAKSSDGLKAKLDHLKSTLEANNKKLESYQKQLQTAQKYEKEASTNVENLKKALEKAKVEYGENSDEVKKLEKELSAAEKTEASLKAQVSNLTVTMNNQEAQVNKTQKEMSDLQGELTKVEKAEKIAAETGKDLDDVLAEMDDEASNAGGGFTVMKGALADLVADGIRAAISAVKDFVSETIKVGQEFDSSMSQVAAVSGATGDELDALREKAKQMGAETKFSASEAAEAFNYMAMAGWKTEDMLEGIDGILALAAAGNTDLATTSDIVTDALTAFGEKADQAGRLADVMAAASSNANTNIEMMGETFKYVAPIAGAMGYSMEDVSVAIGLMANSGIKAGQAGTSLRSILTRLASPPAEAAKAMEELGISITNADGTMKPFSEVMEILRSKFDGLTESQQAQMAKAIGGQEAMSGLLAIVNASPQDFDKLTGAINNSSGAAEEMAAVMQDNLGGDLTELGSKFEGVQLALYEQFEPALRAGVDALSALVDGLNFVVQHFDIFATALASVAAGVGAFLVVMNWTTIMGAATAAITGVQTALTGMFAVMMANPVALVVAAIAALVAGFITLWNTSEEFRAFWIDLWNGIKEAVQPVVDFLSDAFTGAWESIKEEWGQVGEFFSGIWESLTSGAEPEINSIVGFFTTAWDGIKSIWGTVSDFFSGVWDTITTDLEPLITDISDTFSNLWDNIKAIWDKVGPFFTNLWEGIKTSVQPLVDAISHAFSEAWELIKVIWDLVSPYFQQVWEGIKAIFAVVGTILGGFFQVAWEAIKGIWNVAVPFFTAIWESIKAVFSVVGKVLSGFFDVAWAAIKLIWDAVVGYFALVWEGIATVFEVVKDVLSGDFGGAWEAIKGYWNKATSYFKKIWDDIKNVFSKVKTFFSDSFSSAWEAVKKVFSTWKTFFSGLWDTIKNTFTGMGTKIGDAIGGAVKTAINGVISAIESTINRGVDLINGAIGVINKLPGVSVGTINRLSLPRLARGGILKKGQVGLLEGSGAEAVVPLERNRAWIKKVVAELRNQLGVSGMVNAMKGNIAAGITNARNAMASMKSNVNNFTQIINAPKQPSRAELYRQTRNLLNLKGV